MNMSEIEKAVYKIHGEFYRQITNKQYYEYEPSKNDVVTCKKFVGFLKRDFNLISIGYEFLINYFESGWEYWHEKQNLKYGLGSVKLSWLIGKKAYDRWYKIKDQDRDWERFNRGVRKLYRINILTKLRQPKSEFYKKAVVMLNDEEEVERKRFLNQEFGFDWCISSTSLHNPLSSVCQECIYAEDCKELLREKMPNTYKMRHIGEYQ